uniref:SLX9 ribosome biosis factor n=1 Tax=Catagonus wagneri TaxID=51154 RepID=A0A8C3YTY9_9CETA
TAHVRGLVHRVPKEAEARAEGAGAPGCSPARREGTGRDGAPLGSLGGSWVWGQLSCRKVPTRAPGTSPHPARPHSRALGFVHRKGRSLTLCSLSPGAEAKAVLPKKEKLKLRRERWLQKIEAIKLAEQKRQAERRRRATAVVGDLQPLRDALPELLELEAGARPPPARRRAASKPRPAELSRMSAAQRLQLLEEERTRFRELLASPAYRASPLLAIGQQLAQQMQLDSGGRA